MAHIVNFQDPALEPADITFKRIRDHIVESVDTLPDFPIEVMHISTADIPDEDHRVTVVRLTGVSSWRGSQPDVANSILRVYLTHWGLRADIECITGDDAFGGE